MKRQIPLSVGLAVLLLSTLTPSAADASSAQQGTDLGARVDRLEAALVESRTELEAVTAELAETRKLLEQTIDYIHQAAKGASDLQGTFDAAEKAGFTWGENFRSREILLAGLRSYMKGMQQGVPGAAEKQPSAPNKPGAKQPGRRY